MALVKAVVYEEFKRTDGTYNVKIKVYHQKKKRFIDTLHFLAARQLDSKLSIKDKFILNELSFTLTDYRKTIASLGPKLEFMTCDNLKDFLEGKDEEVDFVKFCNSHIAALKEDNRDGTAKNHAKIKNSLIDYFGKDRISYDAPYGDEDDFSLLDRVPVDVESTDHSLMAESTRLEMRSLLSRLSERERKIIELTYGLTGDLEMSPSDISQHVGLSTERVRQIRNDALQKLRLEFTIKNE